MTEFEILHAPPPPSGPVELERDVAHKLLRDMLRIRRMEERCAELYGEGKIRGFLHLYVGEEAIAAGVFDAIDLQDNVVATYREHAHALLRGVPMRAIMAEMYGKQEGCCRGHGGSMHLFDAGRRFFGGNAIVGGGLPVAVGLALADQLQRRSAVTVCFFGEGAMAEGVFHESLNLAALWKLPVLFCCENNLYAMGTALNRSESQTDLTAKAAGYNIPAYKVDGMDVAAVRRVACDARQQVIHGGTPVFVEFQTYRFRAHSMYDPDLYRSKAEVEEWKTRGPIHTYTARLKAQGLLTEEEFLELDRAAGEEVREAVSYAENGQWEPVDQLLRHVYAEPAA